MWTSQNKSEFDGSLTLEKFNTKDKMLNIAKCIKILKDWLIV